MKRHAAAVFQRRNHAPHRGVAFLVADAGGWLTFFAPRERRLIGSVQVPGGPYAAARFDGRYATLTTARGTVATYDIAARETVRPRREADPFTLRDGVLLYATRSRPWVKEIAFGAPGVRVFASREAGALRVEDVDGRERFYNVADGLPCQPVQARDWRGLAVDRELVFTYDGRAYGLADPAHSRGGMVLLCRSLGNDGFALWWTEAGRFRQYQTRPESLPRRLSLLLDAPVEWVPLGPSSALP